MSIKVYTGRMGSGKSYEVVTVVILGALKMGRRVVSNIAGLDYGEMRRVLIGQRVEEGKLGTIVQVDHEAVTSKGFWLTDGDTDAFIRPGDLLVLDEVWRFYDGFGSATPDAVMNFFRMHRHFTHPETGQTCDVALITQDIGDIGRKIRAVVEETYYMEKLTVVGAAKRYRVDIFSGARKYRDAPFRSLQRAYNPNYFCLYQSHSQKGDGSADAKEVNIDDRGNIFKGKFFRLAVPLAVVLFGAGIYRLVGFFGTAPVSKPGVAAVPVATQSTSSPAPIGAPPARPSRHDAVSGLLSSGRARLVYSGMVGGKRLAKVEFLNGEGGLVDAYSEEALFLAGWRLFFGTDGRTAILSNGEGLHVVAVEVRHRLPRIDRKP
ncbi:MAG: hypothetical protein LBU76_00590 [Azoarcus sp.]|jgi:zona occludens toxin|nr:hypothetical protein [Azoarcus sp.]